MDIEKIRNLSVIEEIEVKRSAPPLKAHGEESDRWNDKWNGRKNFKKFRCRGEGVPRLLNRVIVPLEEVKKRDYGIGDEYWLEGDSQRTKKRRDKGRETQDISQGPLQLQPRTRGCEAEQVADDVMEDTTAFNAPPDFTITEERAIANTSATSRSQRLSDKANRAQNIPVQNKRPAQTTLTKPAPTKKLRQVLRKADSDDSEDELKFRFRRTR